METNIRKINKFKDKRVVLLQSGGLDSCVLASILKYLGFEIHHLFVDYGQNAREQERKSVEKIVNSVGGELHCVTLDMPWLKDSTVLAGHEVGEYDVPQQMGCVIAGTYVPMRNHVLLSIASSLAESLDIQYIASGIDGKENFFHKPLTGCPDKHPTFVKKFEQSISEGSSLKHMKHGKYTLITPFVGATKEDIALMRKTVGPELGVKASGGVRTYEDMIVMVEAGASRIGTSNGVKLMK